MKIRKFFLLAIVAVCLVSSFTGGGLTSSEAVQIGGKSLGSIPDIVKTATGSEFPEIPKHSLLIYERHRYRDKMRYKSCILTISGDASAKKRLGEFVQYDSSYLPYDASTGVVQKMDVAISRKPFGNRRNILYTTSGLNVDWDGYADGMADCQTIESTGAEDNAKITIAGKNTQEWRWGARQMWGNASLTVKGMEGKDIFVLPNSSPLDMDGNLYLYFLCVDRNETGSVGANRVDVQGGDIYFGHKVRDHERYYSILAADVATGDFNGDGYKNEILLAYADNGGTAATIFTVNSTDGKTLTVTRNYDISLARHSWRTDHASQPSLAALVGDFDGDGRDEAAVVTRTSWTDIKLTVLKYNNGWTIGELGAGNDFVGTLKATRADLNGDGQDEIVILVIGDTGGTLYPRLEFWGFNRGSIMPVRAWGCNKGGPGDTSLLGYSIGGDEYNRSYKTAEDFSITAGPLSGVRGHITLADDIVISHINSNRNSVYVIPPVLNANRDFIAFGETKTVFNYIDSSNGRRGGVITADFANETMLLGNPTHTIDDKDKTFSTILQAMPYHVDNVDISGDLTDKPINYTFSGFKDDGGSGKMRVAYTKTQANSTQNDVSFGMASSTETISLLGDAGEYVHGYLKFRTMQANIAGNFDERAKAAADTMNTIMDLVTDKIDTTTTNATSQTHQTTTAETFDALLWDRMVSYSAQQHIWRYKILNNPLPSWYKLGPKADYSSKDISKADNEHYLTFTIYDDVEEHLEASNQDSDYQARHEEGNFFSYPSAITDSEGFNPKGVLNNGKWTAWTKGGDASTFLKFEQSKIDSQEYNEEVHESELTKTVSAIASFFGADDPNPLPPYSSHSETFKKTVYDSEQIDIDFYGKSNIPGEEAAHSIMSVPYIAREGTLKVAHAVRLDTSTARLWGAGSRYRKYPDPSLVLPGKYNRHSDSIVANDNNAAAMQIRGMRFYVQAIDVHSDKSMLAGLTYEIKVPIYNASFVKADNFDVRLSYIEESKFDKYHPEKSLKDLQQIQTVTMSMNGWPDNKRWAYFTWSIPRTMETGNYVFFVQIDPETPGKPGLEEVHDSRLDASGNIVDVGGNNDGYFNFDITSEKDAKSKRGITGSSVRASRALSLRGTIYRAVSRKTSGGGEVFSSAEGLGTIDVMSTFEDTNGLDFSDLLQVFGDGLSNGSENDSLTASEDASYPIVMEITYNGDEYYPEAYLCGYNYKAGTQTDHGMVNGGGGDVAHAFLSYRLALVPHTTTTVVINLNKSYMDYENGTGFEIVVPAIAAEAVLQEIANSVEITSQDVSVDDGEKPAEDGNPGESTEEARSSGGGCNALSGSLGVLCLLGLALLGMRKHG